MTQRTELPLPRQAFFWLVVAAFFVLLLWMLRGMLLPFVLGIALAYVADPIADRLQRLYLPRWIATLTVLGLFIGVISLGMVLVLPRVVDQVSQLLEQLPHYIDLFRHRFLPQATRLVAKVGGPHDVADFQKAVTGYIGTATSWFLAALGQVWSGGVALADIGYVVLLTPLVTFYFLRDWHVMIAKLDAWLPRRYAVQLRSIGSEIDQILAGFIRGQATVCLIFAIYYSVALSLTGLDFAIIIGSIAGILTFIPYLGAIAGLVSSVTVAFIQFDDRSHVWVVAGVYLLGHLVEANIVTPMLVGDRVKLHPVWIIFALMAGGALFGFTGVLIAVPVAAIIGVLVRFGISQYLSSGFYHNEIEHLSRIDPSEL